MVYFSIDGVSISWHLVEMTVAQLDVRAIVPADQ